MCLLPAVVLLACLWSSSYQAPLDKPSGVVGNASSQRDLEPKNVLPGTDRRGDPLPPGALARIGSLRLRHAGPVQGIAFGPGSDWLASGGDDGMIRVWQLPGGREIRHWKADNQRGHRLTVSPDGRLIAATGQNGVIRLWDVATGTEREALAGNQTLVAFSPQGQILASAGSDKIIRLWSIATGQLERQMQGQQDQVGALAFSPDGKTLAGAGQKTIRLWETASGKEIRQLRGHDGWVLNLAFAPDSSSLASAGADNTVRLWNPVTGKELRRFEGRSVAFSADGKTLAAAGFGGLSLHDARTGKELRRFFANGPITALALAPDGTMLAALTDHNPEIHVWHMSGGEQGLERDEPRSPIHSLAISQDGKTLITGTWSGVALWDAYTGEEGHVFRLAREAMSSVALSADDQTLAVGTSRELIHLWNVTTWQHWELKGHKGRVNSVAFAPDGRLLASAGVDDPAIHLWDIASLTAASTQAAGEEGKELRQFPVGPGGRALCLAFAPDGKTLAWADGQRIHVTEVATGRTVVQTERLQEPITNVFFTASHGKPLLAGLGQGTFYLWDVASGQKRRRLKVPANLPAGVAVSPDGKTLAVGEMDGSIRLMEMLTGEERQRLDGHQSRVSALIFSPDGKRLFSGSEDTTALIWDMTDEPGKDTPGKAVLSPREIDGLWDDLASGSASKGYQALQALARKPGQSVPFFKERIRPVEAIDQGHTSQLIADLDNDRFAVRRKATAELEKLAELAEPALQAALEHKPSLETRQRLNQLLAKVRGAVPSTERLRVLRSVEALETIGTAEAQDVLQALAGGAPAARPTRDARDALDRLARLRLAGRPKPVPNMAAMPVEQPAAPGPTARADRYGDLLPAGALARMGTVRFRHNATVVAILQGGKVIASGRSGDDAVHLWDSATGKQLRQLTASNTYWSGALAPAPDGKIVACADDRGRIQLWDVSAGKLVREIEAEPAGPAGMPFGRPLCLTFSPDGKTLATGEQQKVRLWDLATGRVLASLPGGNFNKAVAFSPDGKRLAAGGLDKRVRVWDLNKHAEPRLLTGHAKAVETVAFSPDGRIVATAGAYHPDGRMHPPNLADNAIRLWDAATGQELRQCLGHSKGVWAIAFSPDGKLLASGGIDRPVRLWDVATGKLARVCPGSSDWVTAVAFTPDGKTLVTGGPRIRLWDPATGLERLPLEGHDSAAYALALSADGTTVASAGDQTVRVWETSTGKEIHRIAAPARVEAFAANNSMLITGDYDGVVRFSDLASGREIRQLTGHRGPVSCLALSADGTLLASAGGMVRIGTRATDDYRIRLWDVAAGKELLQIGDHHDIVQSIRISPDGKFLASSSNDKTVRLWALATGAEIRRFGNGIWSRTLAFSPDGKVLATGSGEQLVYLWDTATSKELARFPTAANELMSIGFSPDGQVVAVGDNEGVVRLWERVSRQEILRFTGHHGPVNALQFSPDGRVLVSAGEDGNLMVWDVTYRLANGGPAAPILTADDLGRLWEELGASDAREANRAGWTLVAAGPAVVGWIREHLPPAHAAGSRPDGQSPSAPVTQPQTLRQLRAVTVLERIGGSAARDLLETLGRGDSQARLTREAQAALLRLTPPAKKPPAVASRPVRQVPAPDQKKPSAPLGTSRQDLMGDPLPRGALARLGTARWNTGDFVHSLAYSPDGKTVVSGGRNIRIWDAATGRERSHFAYEPSAWLTVAISPDSRWLAYAGYDNAITVYELATAKEVRRLTEPGFRVSCLVFSPDGKTLVSAGDETYLHFWDVITGKQTHRLATAATRHQAIAFSPDGQAFAALGEDGTIGVWRPTDSKELRRFEGFAGHLAFSPDSKTLAAQTNDGAIHLLDWVSGKDLRQLVGQTRRAGFSAPLAFSPDGKRLVTGSGTANNLVHVWDVATGEELAPLQGRREEVTALAFSPDGKVLVSSGGFDCTIRCWNMVTGKELPRPPGHEGRISSLAFSRDGKTVVTAGVDQSLRRWEALTGKELGLLHQEERNRRTFFIVTPDTNLSATLELHGAIALWDMVKGHPPRRFHDPESTSALSLVLSPDGKTLVSGDGYLPLRLWDVAGGKLRARLGKQREPLSIFSSPVFSPDGTHLAAVTGGQGDTIILWDTGTGAELRRINLPNAMFRSLAFCPDGRTLACAGQEIYLWEVATGKERLRLPAGEGIALSPDGRTLAAGGEGNTVRLWDWVLGSEIVQFTGHQGRLTCLAFSSDGQRLASGSWDNSALIWDVATQIKHVSRPAIRLAADELDGLWNDLADEDAARAYRAQARLTAAPSQAVALFRKKLSPAVKPEVLPSSEKLQSSRSLEVLEHIGSPEAQEVLETLAAGARAAPLAQEAKASLERLRRNN